MIKVLFFAQLKELLGRAGCDIIAPTPCNVLQLKSAIIEQHPSWANHLTNNKIMCAVNQNMVDDDFTVNSGDEVAFFPPVTGG